MSNPLMWSFGQSGNAASLNHHCVSGLTLYVPTVNVQAAYHGVPIVGLPLFAEQPDNMARATEQGFGLSVNVNDAMGLSQNLRRALQQVLGDPSFAGNARRVAKLIRSTRWSPASQAASESGCPSLL